jgi:2,5-diamino-6-(ribosylamino)-4(3H)-pyrimidinone 5'-phosphate reductase
VDAVMVGSRTLLDEDPRLIVRLASLRAEREARGLSPNPAKVSLLRQLRDLRLDSRFLTVGPARIILFTGLDAPADTVRTLVERGVEVEQVPTVDGRLDLVSALSRLADAGIARMLVEGGGSLNFELLRLGLVDEVNVFLAPLIFGGASAPTLADGSGLPRADAIRLQRSDAELWTDGSVLVRYKVVNHDE